MCTWIFDETKYVITNLISGRAFLEYECDWHAPVLAEPDSMSDILSQNLSITAGGIQGIGYAPLWVNGKTPRQSLT